MFKNLYRRVACRCLWDSDTDNYAQDLFMTVRAGVFVLLSYWKILKIGRHMPSAHPTYVKSKMHLKNYYTTVL